MTLCHSICQELDNSEVRENCPDKRPHSLLTPLASLGVPKVTLRFDSSLEEVRELTESSNTYGYGLLQGEDTDWNLPKREVYRADPQKVPNMGLPFFSPPGVKMHDFV